MLGDNTLRSNLHAGKLEMSVGMNARKENNLSSNLHAGKLQMSVGTNAGRKQVEIKSPRREAPDEHRETTI